MVVWLLNDRDGRIPTILPFRLLAHGNNISPEIIQLNLKPLRQFANVIQVNLAEEGIIALSAGEDRNLMISVSGDENASIMFSSGANKM